MNEKFQIIEKDKSLYRLDTESGEVCLLTHRDVQGRNASEQFREHYFLRVEEPPEPEDEETEEGEEDEEDDAK